MIKPHAVFFVVCCIPFHIKTCESNHAYLRRIVQDTVPLSLALCAEILAYCKFSWKRTKTVHVSHPYTSDFRIIALDHAVAWGTYSDTDYYNFRCDKLANLSDSWTDLSTTMELANSRTLADQSVYVAVALKSKLTSRHKANWLKIWHLSPDASNIPSPSIFELETCDDEQVVKVIFSSDSHVEYLLIQGNKTTSLFRRNLESSLFEPYDKEKWIKEFEGNWDAHFSPKRLPKTTEPFGKHTCIALSPNRRRAITYWNCFRASIIATFEKTV